MLHKHIIRLLGFHAFLRKFGFPVVITDSPISFITSWESDYNSTWSVHSDTCIVDKVEVHPGTHYKYIMSAYVHTCDCLSVQAFVVKNDDLDFWTLVTADTLCNK